MARRIARRSAPRSAEPSSCCDMRGTEVCFLCSASGYDECMVDGNGGHHLCRPCFDLDQTAISIAPVMPEEKKEAAVELDESMHFLEQAALRAAHDAGVLYDDACRQATIADSLANQAQKARDVAERLQASFDAKLLLQTVCLVLDSLRDRLIKALGVHVDNAAWGLALPEARVQTSSALRDFTAAIDSLCAVLCAEDMSRPAKKQRSSDEEQ